MLYMLLIAHSDPWGRGDANPTTLKNHCVPMRKQNQNHCEKAMFELVNIGLIKVYQYGVKLFYQIENWDKYQSFNYRNRGSKSKFPEPPNHCENKITVNHCDVTVNHCDNSPIIINEDKNLIFEGKKDLKALTTFAPSRGKHPTQEPPVEFCYASKTFKNILPEQVELWKAAYPAVNIEMQLKRAAAWADANPLKKKKNWKRFLQNWFAKAQEAGRDIPSNTASPQKHRVSTESADAMRKRLEAERAAAIPIEQAKEKIQCLKEQLEGK